MLTPQFIVVYYITKINLPTLVGKEVPDNVLMLFKTAEAVMRDLAVIFITKLKPAYGQAGLVLSKLILYFLFLNL